jgi:Chloramphenicol O-acetyltransferase
MNPVDSIPRISWGKYFEEVGKIKLPLSVQAHHALVDGIHVGQFFNTFQEILDNPVKYIYNNSLRVFIFLSFCATFSTPKTKIPILTVKT